MSHRLEQILDRFVALTPAGLTGYKHRVLPLSERDAELPACSWNIGEDGPLDEDGASNLAFLDSLADIETVVLLRAATEQEALEQLLDFRTAVHIAVMADRTLGLNFVIDTRYQGAEEPERDAEHDLVAGRYVLQWQVHYRMNIADPS